MNSMHTRKRVFTSTMNVYWTSVATPAHGQDWTHTEIHTTLHWGPWTTRPILSWTHYPEYYIDWLHLNSSPLYRMNERRNWRVNASRKRYELISAKLKLAYRRFWWDGRNVVNREVRMGLEIFHSAWVRVASARSRNRAQRSKQEESLKKAVLIISIPISRQCSSWLWRGRSDWDTLPGMLSARIYSSKPHGQHWNIDSAYTDTDVGKFDTETPSVENEKTIYARSWLSWIATPKTSKDGSSRSVLFFHLFVIFFGPCITSWPEFAAMTSLPSLGSRRVLFLLSWRVQPYMITALDLLAWKFI